MKQTSESQHTIRRSSYSLLASPLLHQRPVAVLDLEHAEGGEIEPEMIGRRHVDHAAGADEVLGLLDLVAHLGLVERPGALRRLDEDHQPVIGWAAEAGAPLPPVPLVAA